jgi:RNA polymerase sigma-70 factor (ECF subfamily)
LSLQSNDIIFNPSYSFQRGDEKGFTYFFRELYPALSLYAYKITRDKETSEEIASAAFIKIWQKHEGFTDGSSIKAYLYRIVRNDAFKYLGKQKQLALVNKEVIYLYGREQQKDAFTGLVAAETTRLLLKAFSTLPKECSKVFHLLYIEGKSIKETAEALHLSPSTVKTQKARGIEALRKSLHLSLLLSITAIGLLLHNANLTIFA